MALTKRSSEIGTWDPFRELEEMSKRLNQIFTTGAERGGKEALAAFDWTPAVDVSETENAYVLRADLPGVRKEDIKVTVENGVLTLRGERRSRSEQKDEKHHRIESSYGSFLRRFSLPDDAVDEGVKAEAKDGCLEVSVPKATEKKAKARTVQVQ